MSFPPADPTSFDWSSLPQSSGDPMAGSDYTDVSGQAPLASTPFGTNNLAGNGQLPTGGQSGDVTAKILAYLQSQGASGGGTPSFSAPGAGGVPGTGLGNLGSVAGSLGNTIQGNRVIQGNFTQAYDKNMLDAQAARNANESDAMKKLAATSYIASGGSNFKAPTLSLNGKTIQTPDLGYGPQASSAAQIAGANTLQGQLQARLAPGGSYTPQPLSSYATPGPGETLATGASAGLAGAGALINALSGSGGSYNLNGIGGNPQGLTTQQQQSVNDSGGYYNATGQWVDMSSAPGAGQGATAGAGGSNGPSGPSGISQGLGAAGAGLGLAKMAGSGSGSSLGGLLGPGTASASGSLAGDIIPGIGAAAGIYGMIQNKGALSNILSGAGAGASIGSIVPGVGTLIGAGVGAIAGGVEDLFNLGKPSAQELNGRSEQSYITGQLAGMATPAQLTEAKNAGWPDPNQAASLIVMRDKLTASGVPGPQAEAQAESIMKNMWSGESGGASSVAQGLSPIQSMMGSQAPSTVPGTSPSTGGIPWNGTTSGRYVTDAFSQGANG